MNYELRIKNLIIFLIIIGLILPSFSFTPTINLVWGFAQNHKVEPPANPEEAKEMGEKALETTKKDLPGILERIWKEEAIPFWQKMWAWLKGYWQNKLWPTIKGFWERRIRSPVEQEVEKRKNIVEEKIAKNKEEIKGKLIPEATKSLWERFKELIK